MDLQPPDPEIQVPPHRVLRPRVLPRPARVPALRADQLPAAQRDLDDHPIRLEPNLPHPHPREPQKPGKCRRDAHAVPPLQAVDHRTASSLPRGRRARRQPARNLRELLRPRKACSDPESRSLDAASSSLLCTASRGLVCRQVRMLACDGSAVPSSASSSCAIAASVIAEPASRKLASRAMSGPPNSSAGSTSTAAGEGQPVPLLTESAEQVGRPRLGVERRYHPAAHRPLIDTDLFERAQQIPTERGEDHSLRRSNQSD
jgi:hypothetical protein